VIRVEDWAEIRLLHRPEGLSAWYRRAPKGSAVDAVEPSGGSIPRPAATQEGRQHEADTPPLRNYLS
jgi:hypothetical protein